MLKYWPRPLALFGVLLLVCVPKCYAVDPVFTCSNGIPGKMSNWNLKVIPGRNMVMFFDRSNSSYRNYSASVDLCQNLVPGYSETAYLADPVNLQAATNAFQSGASTSLYDCAYVGLTQANNAFEPDFNWTWTRDGSSLESRTPYGILDYWSASQPGDKITSTVENCAAIDWKSYGGLADYTCASATFCSPLCSIPCKSPFQIVVL
jgi:hypothetical protein